MKQYEESSQKFPSRNQWRPKSEETPSKQNQEEKRIRISVIIPSNHPHSELLKIVLQISEQSTPPSEIIIIDSSAERGTCPEPIKIKSQQLRIDLFYRPEEIAYPGRARNLGLDHAKNEFIAFLDVKTSPQPEWLDQAIRLQTDTALFGVWGMTNFNANSRFEKLTRDGFFGRAPRRTLPGTIIRKSTLSHTGRFIDWVRAGEDTDWIQRVELHGLNFTSSDSATLNYTGLLGQKPVALAKKWWRNYTASGELPHLFPQRFLIWALFYPTLILLAFNWNNLVADWETESFFYIPNITKIAIVTPAVLYFVGRGLFIPFCRKVPYSDLLPFRWISIAVVCLVGDLAKGIAMLRPSLKRHAKKRVTRSSD